MIKIETLINRIRQTIENIITRHKRKRTIKALEKIFGFRLHDWQIQFIFEGKLYGKEIRETRANGKTTAHILRLCLSHGSPIRLPHGTIPREDSEITMWMGADGVSFMRRKFFINELRRIYTKLQQGKNLKLRDIRFKSERSIP